ncbi:MAG: hypothetical protein HY900_16555 [Deltaproteobacteria bacterium]|nr:hypothetical protein [Deltaproteobacteria bacterium]
MQTAFMETMMTTLSRFFQGTMEFLPRLLAALVILAIGWLAAWVLKLLVRRALVVARFDSFCAETGATQVLTRADIVDSPSTLVGRVVFWLVFLVFLMAGVSALGLDVFNRLIAEFFLYLPRVFTALGILLVGFLIGNFLSRAVLLAAVNANFPSPRMSSNVVKILIGILAFAMAMEQLQIASSIVTAAFAISFGAVMLGLALAFGLGGRGVARQVLERQFLGEKEDKPDEFSHI